VETSGTRSVLGLRLLSGSHLCGKFLVSGILFLDALIDEQLKLQSVHCHLLLYTLL